MNFLSYNFSEYLDLIIEKKLFISFDEITYSSFIFYVAIYLGQMCNPVYARLKEFELW